MQLTQELLNRSMCSATVRSTLLVAVAFLASSRLILQVNSRLPDKNDYFSFSTADYRQEEGQLLRPFALSSSMSQLNTVTAAQAVTDCDNDYLMLDFVCDPSRLLSHTEAALLNCSIPKHFSFCNRNTGTRDSPVAISEDYKVGIVLLKNLYAPGFDRCRRARPLDRSPSLNLRWSTNFSALLVLEQRLLQQKADLMRRLWNERMLHCSVDIMAIMVQAVYFCVKNGAVIRPNKSRRFAIGVSLSQRLKSSVVTAQDVVNGYQNFSDVSDVSAGLADGVTVKDILKLFKVLDMLLAAVNPNPLTTGDVYGYLPVHYIPEWASVLFAVCLVLTVACTLLGQWLNTSHRKRIFRPSPHLYIRPGPKRRWRAGFGGGLIELRGNTGGDDGNADPFQDYNNYRS